MTTLKNLKGTAIQFLDEDPVVQGVAGGTWASGGALNNGVNASGGSNAGSQTASINFAGNANPYPTVTAATESYNGTSWSSVNSMNTARWSLSSFGPYTAAVGVSGVTDVNAVLPTTAVEQWNGTNWTEVAELATVRHASGGFGTGTAALIVGGQSRPGSPPGTPVTYRANVEAWNGTSWTAGTAINTARDTMFSFGINTSGLIANGQNPSLVSNTESWNGSSWTEVAESNTTRYSGGAAGSSNTLGLIFGGYGPSYSSQTEYWDGTSWTELNNLATARANSKGSGSVPSALAFAGTSGPGGSALTATEEWTTAPTNSIGLQEGDMWFNSSSSVLKGYGKAAGIPAATWSSGGAMNEERYYGYGAGKTQDSAIVSGGVDESSPSNDLTQTEIYNGSSWTEVNDMNTGRAGGGSTGQGTTTATLIFGGSISPGTNKNETETWDGSSWTEVNNLNTARQGGGGFGTQSLAFYAAGYTTADVNSVESWDGTSWTETTEVNTARRYMGSAGFSTDGMIFGANPATGATEIWNGSSWTEVNDMNTGRGFRPGSAGITTSALCFGGSLTGPSLSVTEAWNGTSWTEVNDLSTARRSLAGAGSAVSALALGGYTTTAVDTVEEWTATAGVSTITTS
jgi:hypothetical protein